MAASSSTSEAFLNSLQREIQEKPGPGDTSGSELMAAIQALEFWRDDVMWTAIITHDDVALRLPNSLHSRSPQKCWVDSNLVSRGQQQRSLGSSNIHS